MAQPLWASRSRVSGTPPKIQVGVCPTPTIFVYFVTCNWLLLSCTSTTGVFRSFYCFFYKFAREQGSKGERMHAPQFLRFLCLTYALTYASTVLAYFFNFLLHSYVISSSTSTAVSGCIAACTLQDGAALFITAVVCPPFKALSSGFTRHEVRTRFS